MTPSKFRALVWRFYKKQGRHDLPWRKTHDPYRILVSEIMLQQTQVERVIPFYTSFLKAFPTARLLSQAPLSLVLKHWQGLGYNRRAKMLHQAAGQMTKLQLKRLAPSELISTLEQLPGVGPYTARAVAAFAFNADVTFVETNIRTVVIHHFFEDKEKVTDAAIDEMLVRILPKGKSREWYSALMDYGASLKRSGISHNARSTVHVKQATFLGSVREARGAILRKLALGGSAAPGELIDLLGAARRTQMRAALRALWSEQLIEKRGDTYALTGET